ncbi:uncharacterized protein PG998_002805 [Apiospora kogelbergensis]|uniref:uncharacterized protein n=1 Tax=Apiospora kogelbergensis TaxID=1337665 RepID=UPI00312ED4FB
MPPKSVSKPVLPHNKIHPPLNTPSSIPLITPTFSHKSYYKPAHNGRPILPLLRRAAGRHRRRRPLDAPSAEATPTPSTMTAPLTTDAASAAGGAGTQDYDPAIGDMMFLYNREEAPSAGNKVTN